MSSHSGYTRLSSVYEYWDYADDLGNVYLDNKSFFIIKSIEVESIKIDNVWFKPDDLLIYKVEIKIDGNIMDNMLSFFHSKEKVAFSITGSVLTVSDIIEPASFEDNIIVLSVLGRSKQQIKEQLLEITNNITISDNKEEGANMFREEGTNTFKSKVRKWFTPLR
jgi:hypothetical protein